MISTWRDNNIRSIAIPNGFALVYLIQLLFTEYVSNGQGFNTLEVEPNGLFSPLSPILLDAILIFL